MEMVKLGFALTGSFCTFRKVIPVMREMAKNGYDITPIMSFNAYKLDTKFGKSADFREEIKKICGKEIIADIPSAEPIGPMKMFDVLVVAPCTGNTLSKLVNAVIDTPVAMAVKSHLRNDRPVVIAVSTNDALSGSAKNIGELLNRRHYYFVPLKQDNPDKKPRSAVALMDLLPQTIEKALEGKQIQPILY